MANTPLSIVKALGAIAADAPVAAIQQGGLAASALPAAATAGHIVRILTDLYGRLWITGSWVGVHDSAAPTDMVMVGEVAESTFPTSVADGDAVRKYVDPEGRQVIKGYDNSADAVRMVDPAPAVNQKLGPITFAQLTAIGATVATNVRPYSNLCWQVTVAALAAGENCVVRAEGTTDNSVWFNLDDAGVDTTITANGTYTLSVTGVSVEYTRFNFVTDSASGAVTLDAKLMAGVA